MRRLLLGICALALFPGTGFANTPNKHRSHGYLVFAPGAFSPGGAAAVHLGGGGEGLVYKGLGVGAEIGYILPWDERAGLGLFSANGSYHLTGHGSPEKLVPFATAGYSLLFRGGSANLFNFGGGFHYWFGKGTGLRVEFRDHVWPNHRTVHLWEFRVGVAFR